MAGILNRSAYQQLFDEDIEWVLKQPRTLERDHVVDCLRWLREHRPDDDGSYEVKLEEKIAELQAGIADLATRSESTCVCKELRTLSAEVSGS